MKNFIKERKWLHFRKRIKHSTANIRLCQRPPPKARDGTKVHDYLQDLRINQYGQYIHEKLGLFKKPTKLELMIFNYEKGDYSQANHRRSSTFESPESLIPSKILKAQRDICNTESPKRDSHEHYLVKSINIPQRKVSSNQMKLLQNIKLSARRMHKTDIFSNDYDDKDFKKLKKYENAAKDILKKRKMISHTADKQSVRNRILIKCVNQ